MWARPDGQCSHSADICCVWVAMVCRMICTVGWVGVDGGMVEARTSTCMVVGGSSGSVAHCQPQEIVTLVTGLCGMGHVVQVGGG